MTLEETTPLIQQSLKNFDEDIPLVNPSSPLLAYLENLTPCFSTDCRGKYVVSLVLGGNQSSWLVLFNGLLIVYNILRFYVIHTVNILREEGEHGGWSPRKNEIDPLITMHIVVKSLWFVAVSVGLVNLISSLFEVVQVPA
jgi:hypothetical protein